MKFVFELKGLDPYMPDVRLENTRSMAAIRHDVV